MGWDRKDAMGNSLELGDYVKIIKHRKDDMTSDALCDMSPEDVIGMVLEVDALEGSDYNGRYHVGIDGHGWISYKVVVKV